MTREEAIKIIDCYDIGFYDLSGEKIPADKLADAFDMAIEALSAEAEEYEDYEHATLVDIKAPLRASAEGEWIDCIGADLGIEGQWLRDDGKTVFVQCDQCDSTFVRNLMTHMNFCPNCGAKMKGADDED